MSRLAALEPPYAPEIQAQFDQIMRGAPPLMLFRVVAGQARAWEKFRAGSLLDRGPPSLRQREIVIDRTSALTGCEYEWGVHVAAFAAAAHLTDEQVRATLSDEEFKALAAHYDDAKIFEIILLCGFYRTVSYLANGLDLPLEEKTARFPR